MTNKTLKKNIHNLNSSIIASLSIIGLLWDGYQVEDIFFSASLLIWLWQSEWDQLEERLIGIWRNTTASTSPVLDKTAIIAQERKTPRYDKIHQQSFMPILGVHKASHLTAYILPEKIYRDNPQIIEWLQLPDGKCDCSPT